ncbi:MAG: nucleoid occlusion protein [Desulfobacterales bacterium]|nr:nucleoid occlusion protein [Desulfobacterales bacterium]
MKEKWVEQFPQNENEPATDKVLAIDIDKIRPNPFQPRREISEEKIDELAQSIKACGLIQPVVVRRAGNGYQLVVGERRYLACRKLGWKKISAAVQTLSDNAMATIALIENLQRENLNYIEEATGYVSLMKNFDLTQEVLAQRLGKSQSTIANKIRLLRLTKKVQEKLLTQGLTERHARALIRLDSEEQQLKTIHEIAERGLTVSQTEKRIEKISEQVRSKEKTKRMKPIIRDMRIVLNTIRKAVAIIQSSGLYPEVEETIEPDYIEVTIRLTREMLQPGNK